MNTHIYYHCNRIKKYDCPEPYITEQELITQLIGFLPQIKLNTSYLMAEFATEVQRLKHLKATVLNEQAPQFEITPHYTNTTDSQFKVDLPETQTDSLKEYLLHVLQFGTPEERIKILKGVTSKFNLRQRQLQLS